MGMLRWFLGIFFVNFLISEGNQSFLKFSSRWQESHESWTNLEWDILRTCQRKYILPVCVDGSSINDPTSCSKAVCYHSEQHCFPTPSDTLDYLPPSSSTAKICEPLSMNHPLPPYYGMEGGIPPEFSNRRSVNLWLFGTIKSTDSCQPLTGVQLQFFHVDNDLYDEDSVVDEGDLRDMSCLGTVDLDDNGGYSFRTTVPPSYGPPRHINLIIKAPGHQILVTRIYFSQDIRLQQLSVGSDVLASHESGFYETSYEFQTEENSRPFLRNILSREPRVCDLKFVADETGGHLEGLHNIFLQPNLPEFSFASLSGYWTEPNGALIRVENIGHYFFASQYPHLRTWGSVSGFIRENSIFGVNFRNSGIFNLSTFSESRTVLSSSLTVGEILPIDPFNSNGDSGQIVWQGPDVQTTWHKYPNIEGYRYLKLVVSRIGTSELDTSGSLLINEIEFYEGYLSQIEIPSKSSKLLSPRTPSPLRVLCSSFTDQDHHCYKAFDGDTSPGSYWRTKPVGEHRNQISSEAWILLDLGIGENSLSRDIDIGRRMRPTAMKIVCGVGSSLAGCPMTFALYGSNEPYSNFELIVTHDSYDFNASDYASGGKLFNFYEDTPYGRAIGQRCGSCDRHPRYMCAKGAFDTSCESMFCTSEGVCGEPEPCPIGQYSSMQFIGDGLPQFSCHFCPAGKYGNISGLMSQYCAGECDAGCYCNSGSTQSCQYKCGAPSYFCPKGSSQPLLAGAGMKTVDAFGNNEDNSLEMRVSVLPCSLGHYCQGGVERKCPAGTFGSDTMLSSPACSGDCQPGYYCPAGTVNPIKCPLGHYCADGIAKVPCPAGSYGSIEGLRDRECSGKCQPGFYCLSGSKSPQERQCPKGRYGSEFNLSTALCSGPCSPGYFCPAGSVTPTASECGSNSVYCPEGSYQPIPVSKGYFSIGETPRTRHGQLICPKGFYCPENGEKYPCPAGSYGDSEGLSSSCAGFCQPGYYCPLNSSSSKSVPCPAGTYGNTYGLSDSNCTSLCPVGTYCPEGSISPVPCPAGVFGGYRGLKDHHCSPECADGLCSDEAIEASLCREGFYCPIGSTSPTQIECGGSEYYCPKGSAKPVSVDVGCYSKGGSSTMSRTSQELCPLGHYCINGIVIPCPPGVFGNSFGLFSPSCSGPCPMGHYCPLGTINGTTYRCPGGRYGNSTNLFDAACSGECAAGYYCPEGSTSPHEIECGTYLGLENKVYCLPGTSLPIPVPDGYYSLGGNKTTRIGVRQCGLGTYCVNGTVYDCPAGRYGNSLGLSSPLCSGVCRAGFYCPVGSVRSNQVRCPRGRKSNKEGLKDADCAGPCQNPLDCTEF